MNHLDIVECPRDAWQGIHDFIPTQKKIEHLKSLLKCGFHTIDAGSFVSPKAMPQMADANTLFEGLEESLATSETKLLAIVANEEGAVRAAQFPWIRVWGYPFSVSEQFQLRNSRKDLKGAQEDLKRVKELAAACGVELVVYLSMSFGNPYKEVYHQDLVMERWEQAVDCGADIISISDTTGVGSNEAIAALCQKASSMGKPWGAHLHSAYDEAAEKALTAIENGCRRIDTALRGFGGCPFAQDSLIGNMPTEKVLSVATAHGYAHELNALFIESSYNSALKLFGAYS